MSLPGKYGDEAGIASGYNQSVGSLIPGPTPLYIPGFQPGTRPIRRYVLWGVPQFCY